MAVFLQGNHGAWRGEQVSRPPRKTLLNSPAWPTLHGHPCVRSQAGLWLQGTLPVTRMSPNQFSVASQMGPWSPALSRGPASRTLSPSRGQESWKAAHPQITTATAVGAVGVPGLEETMPLQVGDPFFFPRVRARGKEPEEVKSTGSGSQATVRGGAHGFHNIQLPRPHVHHHRH